MRSDSRAIFAAVSLVFLVACGNMEKAEVAPKPAAPPEAAASADKPSMAASSQGGQSKVEKEQAVPVNPHFVQDRFAIGFWVDPPIGEDADARYREIAEANFTIVLGGFGARTPEKVKRQIELCEKYGLVGVVSRAGLPHDQLPESPACWGYMIRDEPNVKDFPALAKVVSEIREARPGRLSYINLYPNYANERQLGTKTYDEHVCRFVDEVGVDVLSMDHYPIMRPGTDNRSAYCSNLAVMRKYSLKKDIPFWNFFNVMPFGPHTDPTEAQIRWQVFTSVAYGAKGVLYFCYWTPGGREFPKGGAVITAEGRRTRHYEQAKRVNAKLKNLGPTLMKLTSTGVCRIEPNADPDKVLSDSAIRKLTRAHAGEEFIVAEFAHADGRRAVLLANYSITYTAWPTVEFDADPSQVVEVCQATGKGVALADDSPAMPGVQLSLDSGDARLFILPPK